MKSIIISTEEKNGRYIIKTSDSTEFVFLTEHKDINIIKSWKTGTFIQWEGFDDGYTTTGYNVYHESSKKAFLCGIIEN